MRITASCDPDYTANFVCMKMEFFYQGSLKATLDIRTIKHATETLNDWARLKIDLADVLAFQKIADMYIGCSVDDVKYNYDGTSFIINGKPLELI